MNCIHHFRLSNSREEDTLTEIRYETYLERYNNISLEINALRTKSAIMIGVLGVIFSILVMIYLNNPFAPLLPRQYLTIISGIFILIWASYFSIYVYLHMEKIHTYPDDDTLNYVDSDVDIAPAPRHRYEHLQNIIPNIKNKSDSLYKSYKYYSNMLFIIDIMFLFLFLICSVGFLRIVQGSVFIGIEYLIFLFISSLILAGCFSVIIFLLFGVAKEKRDWLVDNKKSFIIGLGILTVVIIWVMLVFIIIGM